MILVVNFWEGFQDLIFINGFEILLFFMRGGMGVNRDDCIGGCTSAGRRVLMEIEQTWKSTKLFDRQISAIKEETKNAKKSPQKKTTFSHSL